MSSQKTSLALGLNMGRLVLFRSWRALPHEHAPLITPLLICTAVVTYHSLPCSLVIQADADMTPLGTSFVQSAFMAAIHEQTSSCRATHDSITWKHKRLCKSWGRSLLRRYGSSRSYFTEPVQPQTLPSEPFQRQHLADHKPSSSRGGTSNAIRFRLLLDTANKQFVIDAMPSLVLHMLFVRP